MKPFCCQEARMAEQKETTHNKKNFLIQKVISERTKPNKTKRTMSKQPNWNEMSNWIEYMQAKKDEMPIVAIAFRLISSVFLWTSSRPHFTMPSVFVLVCSSPTLLFGIWKCRQLWHLPSVSYSCCLNSVSKCLLHCLPMVQCRSTKKKIMLDLIYPIQALPKAVFA